ncbi:HRDC domain-containing protein [Mesotoga sp.]|uniref:HRDC domain-containing protein n=1 Tax=Mesotoga sp. TaxID=2053577 RepID=UPI00345E6B5A
MAFRIITDPFDNEREVFPDNELNNFLLDKKVRSYRVEFFIHAGRPYWSVFLEYEEIEDRSVEKLTQSLNERQKLIFERLKDWRKEKGKEVGMPVYIIFSNGQLVELAKRLPQTYEAMKSINGIGDKKVKSFGKEVMDILRTFEGNND